MEQKPTSDHAVFTFGRFNPPTTGHKKLVDKVVSHAWQHKADNYVFASHSSDAKKNPLSHSQKIGFMKKFFPHANIHSGEGIKTALDAVNHLHSKGYKKATMIVGDDRQQEFHNLLHKYKPEGMHIEVKSAGQRDPDAEGVEGMSASKMRDHAQKKNFREFKKGVPNPAHAKELYHAVRKGMKLENFHRHFKALFIVGGPGSGKDFIINSLIEDTNLLEMQIDKFYTAVMNGDEVRLEEFADYPSVILNGNADNLDKIVVSKRILETMGYDTSMVYVYTSDEESKARNDERIQRGSKTFSEEVRHDKYVHSIENMHRFTGLFETFNIFDNSGDFAELNALKKQEVLGWLNELGNQISEFFRTPPSNESSKLWLMENTKKPNMGMKLPVVPKPIGGGENHKSNLKGYKRVKVGSFWKLVKEDGIGDKASEGDTDKGEPMAKDAGKKKKKNEKTMTPPPSFFDQRMGMVPSGGVGITVSHYEHPKAPVIQEKSFEKLRKNLNALTNNLDEE